MKKYYNFFILFLMAFLSTRLFSFTLIEKNYFDYLEVIIACVIIIMVLLDLQKVLLTKWAFPEVKWIFIITICSFFPALIFHNQEISWSLLATRTNYIWLIYYLLKTNNIPIRALHKVMLFMGGAWCLIMILQQITYPTIYFNFLSGSDSEINRYENRGNLLRIFVDGSSFGFYFLFFYWYRLTKEVNVKNVFMISIGLLGILLTGSRQVILSVFLVFLFSIIKKIRKIAKKNMKFIFVFTILIITLILYGGTYLLSLINLSLEQDITSDSYIRILEIKFFALDYWPDFFSIFIGNGWEHSLSDYGKEIIKFKEMYGFYRSDIGIIGGFNKFGFFYVFAILSLAFKILKRKEKLMVPEIIQYFFLLLFLTSFSGANYFETPSWIFIIVSLLYIIEKINEKNINISSNT